MKSDNQKGGPDITECIVENTQETSDDKIDDDEEQINDASLTWSILQVFRAILN